MIMIHYNIIFIFFKVKNFPSIQRFYIWYLIITKLPRFYFHLSHQNVEYNNELVTSNMHLQKKYSNIFSNS